jgi:hypothetical protein
VVLAYVAMLGASLALQYKEALAAITPFPDNDEVLTSKVKTPLACNWMRDRSSMLGTA